MRKGSSFIVASQMVLEWVTWTCPVLVVSCKKIKKNNTEKTLLLSSSFPVLLTDLSRTIQVKRLS